MERGGKIQRLDPLVSRRICAGQVIGSPGCVVKELVENSLDSGAKAITIFVGAQGCGLDSIMIGDNGKGIATQEYELLGENYATSKITNFKDLHQGLSTYGFRGEALHSIRELAEKIVIWTRNHSSHLPGKCSLWDLSLSDKKICSDNLDIAGTPLRGFVHDGNGTGTVIRIEGLFYKLPVRRRRQLQSSIIKAEIAKIRHLVCSYCLAIPEINIRLEIPSTTSANFMSSSHSLLLIGGIESKDPLDIVEQVYGPQIARTLTKIEKTISNSGAQREEEVDPEAILSKIKITLVLPRPNLNAKSLAAAVRSITDRNWVIMNKRPVEWNPALKIVRTMFRKHYYAESLSTGGEISSSKVSRCYPFCIVIIDLPGHLTDFNLTPDKKAIMLTNEEDLLSTIHSMCSDFYDIKSSDEAGKVGQPNETESISTHIQEEKLASQDSRRNDLENIENSPVHLADSQTIISPELNDGFISKSENANPKKSWLLAFKADQETEKQPPSKKHKTVAERVPLENQSIITEQLTLTKNSLEPSNHKILRTEIASSDEPVTSTESGSRNQITNDSQFSAVGGFTSHSGVTIQLNNKGNVQTNLVPKIWSTERSSQRIPRIIGPLSKPPQLARRLTLSRGPTSLWICADNYQLYCWNSYQSLLERNLIELFANYRFPGQNLVNPIPISECPYGFEQEKEAMENMQQEVHNSIRQNGFRLIRHQQGDIATFEITGTTSLIDFLDEEEIIEVVWLSARAGLYMTDRNRHSEDDTLDKIRGNDLHPLYRPQKMGDFLRNQAANDSCNATMSLEDASKLFDWYWKRCEGQIPPSQWQFIHDFTPTDTQLTDA